MTRTELVLLTRARRDAASGRGRALREEAHLSLREVAVSLGVTATTLWRWEAGDRVPRGAAAVAWARLLDDLTKAAA